MVSPLAAQEETLFSGDVEHGGFGGPVIKFSQINNKNALLVGGRGGWIIDHRITIGGGGYGLITKVPTINSQVDGADSLSLGMGYGGFQLGYIHNSNRMIHFAFQTLIGGGGVSHMQWDNEFDFNFEEEGDGFFILEPSVDVVLNVSTFFRICAGISYRYISGVDLDGLSDSDLSGTSAQLTLKFGSF